MAKKTPFERETRELLEKTYALTERLPDILIKTSSGKSVTAEKPADLVACDELGFFCLVECKSNRQGVFSFSDIRENQRKALTIVSETKYGKAYLALNLREKRHPGKAWLIPWSFWMDFEERLWRKKSIRREEAIEIFKAFALTRITGGWETNETHQNERRG